MLIQYLAQHTLNKRENSEATTQACGIKLSQYPEGDTTTAQGGVGGGRHNFCQWYGIPSQYLHTCEIYHGTIHWEKDDR